MPGGNTSLKNILENQGSPLSVENGGQPAIPDFALSKLHDTYSIDGIPEVPLKPAPSQLDLDGGLPASGPYLDNLPQ